MAQPNPVEEEPNVDVHIWIADNCLFIRNQCYSPMVVMITVAGNNFELLLNEAPPTDCITPATANYRDLNGNKNGNLWNTEELKWGPAILPPRRHLVNGAKQTISNVYIAGFKHVDRFKEWSFDYQSHIAKGDPLATHEALYLYKYPYPGKKRIGQGYGGLYLHQGNLQHGIDFLMAKGTTLKAARDGVVIDIVNDKKDGGQSAAFNGDWGNKVVVLHDDHSFATYCHLQKVNKELVIGTRVNAGDKIAKSGNTGHICVKKPHLHFDVSVWKIPAEGENAGNPFKLIRVTVPTKFEEKNSARDGADLKEGMRVP